MESLIKTEFGHFPSSWHLCTVDSLFHIQQGKQVSKKNREGNNQRPFLRTKNVFWGRIELSDLDHMHFTPQEEARLSLKAGDLLLCEGGAVGRTAIWKEEVQNCYFQNHIHRLRAIDSEVDPQFALFWFWYAFELSSTYFGHGNITTIPNLSRSRLGALLMPKPPLEEQEKIAATLDSVCLRIYNAEAKKRCLEDLFRTLLHQLMTRDPKNLI